MDNVCSYKQRKKNNSLDLSIRLGPSAQLEDILNTVDRLQQFRLDDQRTNLPTANQHDNRRLSPANERFLDQLSKCQVRQSTKTFVSTFY